MARKTYGGALWTFDGCLQVASPDCCGGLISAEDRVWWSSGGVARTGGGVTLDLCLERQSGKSEADLSSDGT